MAILFARNTFSGEWSYVTHDMFNLHMLVRQHWWTRVHFLRQGPKSGFYPILAKIHKIYFARGVLCEPEALLAGALGGLVYFMSICVDVPVKIDMGAFSNQQWKVELRSLIAFLYEFFLKTGVNCNYIQDNGGLGWWCFPFTSNMS